VAFDHAQCDHCTTRQCRKVCYMNALQMSGRWYTKEINLLPFHRLGASKHQQLGLVCDSEDQVAMKPEKLAPLAAVYRESGLDCYLWSDTPRCGGLSARPPVMAAVEVQEGLLGQIQEWTTALDVMAVFADQTGVVRFANAPFRRFSGSGCSLLKEVEPVRPFFGGEMPNSPQVHAFERKERSLLAVRISFPLTAGCWKPRSSRRCASAWNCSNRSWTPPTTRCSSSTATASSPASTAATGRSTT
jgi:hypothetical protein